MKDKAISNVKAEELVDQLDMKSILEYEKHVISGQVNLFSHEEVMKKLTSNKGNKEN